MAKLFHPLLALIASATDRELARYVQFLKEENRILRGRFGKEVHTRPEERRRLVELGKVLDRAVEELITIVSPSTFYAGPAKRSTGSRSRTQRAGSGRPERSASW